MTGRQLAREVGVSANTVSSWRKGTHLPRAGHLAAIASALEVDLSELTGSTSLKDPTLARADDDRSAAIVFKLAHLEIEPVLQALVQATPELLAALREATDHAQRVKDDEQLAP